MNHISNTVVGLLYLTWPMVIICLIVYISLRATYIYTNKIHIVIYEEILLLVSLIYILSFFQVVSYQDVALEGTGLNLIPFKEMLRYSIGSRLFLKNVLGNAMLFFPYGVLICHYTKNKDIKVVTLLLLIASCSVECIQLLIGRVFDIDDIILNIFGGLCGYLFYISLHVIWDLLPKFFKKEIVLDILSVIMLIGSCLLIYHILF